MLDEMQKKRSAASHPTPLPEKTYGEVGRLPHKVYMIETAATTSCLGRGLTPRVAST